MQAQAVALSKQIQPLMQARALWLMLLAAAFVLMQTHNAFARPESLAPLAEQISPAVVNITTSTVVERPTGSQGIVPEGSPFEDFFNERRQDDNGEGPRPRRSSALGSGFVISEDGYIVTNDHVIKGADEILIEFFPGEGQPSVELPAKVIGTDPKTDIALLKVEADQPLAFVPFGNSDDSRVGDWVIAMGNPLGQGFSVSAGIVSARNRALSGSYDDYIQTDAAINRGNSGGPLFNMDGEVIGVNTAILSPNGGSIGIGFSMASNVVTRVVDQLREFGETRRGWLGVSIQDVTSDIAEAIGLEDTDGALVNSVQDGPAKAGGMEDGDVILSFAGKPVKDTRALVRRVANSPVGETVRVVVMREGKTVTLKITLGRREEAEGAVQTAAQAPDQEEKASESKVVLGLTLSVLTDELREQLGVAKDLNGLAITEVDETSEAFEKGLRAGDVITEADQQKITSIADLETRLGERKEAGRKSFLLLVRRAGDPRFVALSLK